MPAFTFWSTPQRCCTTTRSPSLSTSTPKTYTSTEADQGEDHRADEGVSPVDITACRVIWIRSSTCPEAQPCGDSSLLPGAGNWREAAKVGSIAGRHRILVQSVEEPLGGEGDLYTTNNEAWAKHATMMRVWRGGRRRAAARENNAFGLGWMYRPHEFINAFILSQLSRLDQHNGVRKEFAAYLTEQLAQIRA